MDILSHREAKPGISEIASISCPTAAMCRGSVAERCWLAIDHAASRLARQLVPCPILDSRRMKYGIYRKDRGSIKLGDGLARSTEELELQPRSSKVFTRRPNRRHAAFCARKRQNFRPKSTSLQKLTFWILIHSGAKMATKYEQAQNWMRRISGGLDMI